MNMEGSQQFNKREKILQHITVEDLRNTRDIIELNGIKYMPSLEELSRNPELLKEIYEDDEDSREDLTYFNPLVYAGINGFFLEAGDGGDFFYDIENAFKIGRLRAVRQLSLARGVTFPDGDIEFLEGFHHSRYVHSFDVLSIANLIGHNLGLNKKDLQILQIAALSHDYRTPALGDTTKKVDPPAFDEDVLYPEIFSSENWIDFAKKYQISSTDQDLLKQTILGRGVLGRILDLSDKIGYVSRDLVRYLKTEVRVVKHDRGSSGFEQIKALTESNPLLCSFWESLEISGENIVINDVDKLSNFLRVRALLWKHLYENYDGGLSVAMIGERVLRFLYEKGEINDKAMLRMGDSDLSGVIDNFLGTNIPFDLVHKIPHERFVFSDLDSALDFAREQSKEESKIVILDDFKIASTSSTKKFLVKKDGVITSFDQAMPGEAREIDSIMQVPNQVFVYTADLKDIGVQQDRFQEVKKAFSL